VPTRQILFCTPKGTCFLVRLPRADDICMAITVKNLRPRPPLRSEGDMCPPGKYYFVPKKAHLFWCVYHKRMILYGNHGEEPASPAATPLSGRYVPTRQILFCTPKGTSFLVRLPQADDICTALTDKNLRPPPPLCQFALRAICAHQANIILYPKRHMFFGEFTAS
jgi:hypothetical protein